MPTTRMQVLGWIEHCESEHPGLGTMIPTWLCTIEALHEAIADGDVQQIGQRALIPRMGISSVIYGLTDQGRLKFYEGTPVAGEIETAMDERGSD
jgi:hypothetical protein